MQYPTRVVSKLIKLSGCGFVSEDTMQQCFSQFNGLQQVIGDLQMFCEKSVGFQYIPADGSYPALVINIGSSATVWEIPDSLSSDGGCVLEPQRLETTGGLGNIDDWESICAQLQAGKTLQMRATRGYLKGGASDGQGDVHDVGTEATQTTPPSHVSPSPRPVPFAPAAAPRLRSPAHKRIKLEQSSPTGLRINSFDVNTECCLVCNVFLKCFLFVTSPRFTYRTFFECLVWLDC